MCAPNMLQQLPANSSTVNQRKSALIMTSQMGLSTITANGSIHYKEPAKAQAPSFRGSAHPEVLSPWARILSKSLFTIKLPGKTNVIVKWSSLQWNKMEILEFDKFVRYCWQNADTFWMSFFFFIPEAVLVSSWSIWKQQYKFFTCSFSLICCFVNVFLRYIWKPG